MALVLKDRVKEVTSTTGTGTLTLAGAASGYQSFAVIGNGNTTYYAIVDPATGDWEVGLGTYTASGTTLSRSTILESSNSGSAVNFGAGTKEVFCTYPAEKSALFDQIPTNNNQLTNGAGYITGNQTITLSGDVSGSGTTSISVTVADDSHNHIISNVDGLQTALDGKVADTGDTITGTLTMGYNGSGYSHTISLQGASGSTGEVGLRAYGESFQIYEPEDANKVWLEIADDPSGNNTALKVNSSGGMQTVWHAGNDGSGSGLDADTLDGNEASAFATSSHNHDGVYVKEGGTTFNSTYPVCVRTSEDVIYSHTGIQYTGSTSSLSLAGDLTVSGGDIVLGGTGRIQGIDTVSASTDAASKGYVDTAVAGAIGTTFPFYKSDGSSDTIAITNGSFPFYKSNGTQDNIGVS